MLVQADTFDTVLAKLSGSDILVVDTETEWTENWHRKLIGVAVLVPGDASYYFPYRHTHQQTLFPVDNLPVETLPLLGKALQNNTLVFHNAKFDLQVLEREGIVCEGNFWDTMLMAHMVNENEFSFALKTLGKRFVHEDADFEQKKLKQIAKNLGGWECVPPDVMGIYAEKDVALTWALYQFYLPQLEEQDLIDLWPDEMDFSRCLSIVEKHGILLNQEQSKRLAYQAQCRLQELEDELGFDPMKPDQLARTLFGAPPEGLGFLPGLLGKPSKSFPKGRPIMDEAALSKYAHPTVDKVLEYRSVVKAQSTWFQGFLDTVCECGRLHPGYRQHGTVTTRLSCANPNMQQLPRVDESDQTASVLKAQVKTQLACPVGTELWEFDYSQVEFRLAACYAKEDLILDAYRAGSDFHQATADALGISRHQAKTLNFAILYGAGPVKIAEMLGVQVLRAKELLEQFWEQYPRLEKTVQAFYQTALQRGWVLFWTGRRRHFQWPSEAHKAFNSVIQGGAAEIMKKTMLYFYREHPEIKIVAQVHDALWFEVPVEKKEEQFALIRNTMEWPGREGFPIEFPVDTKRLAA